MVKTDMEGKVLEGEYKPSSEIKMHLQIYKDDPEVMGVTHMHPPIATAFAVAGLPLNRAILTEAVLSIGTVLVAPYALPGTVQVPESIKPFIKDYNAVLLANHGALSWAKDLYQSFYFMEAIEQYATITMYTEKIIGQQNSLNPEEIEALLEMRKEWGIKKGGVPAVEG